MSASTSLDVSLKPAQVLTVLTVLTTFPLRSCHHGNAAIDTFIDNHGLFIHTAHTCDNFLAWIISGSTGIPLVTVGNAFDHADGALVEATEAAMT